MIRKYIRHKLVEAGFAMHDASWFEKKVGKESTIRICHIQKPDFYCMSIPELMVSASETSFKHTLNAMLEAIGMRLQHWRENPDDLRYSWKTWFEIDLTEADLQIRDLLTRIEE